MPVFLYQMVEESMNDITDKNEPGTATKTKKPKPQVTTEGALITVRSGRELLCMPAKNIYAVSVRCNVLYIVARTSPEAAPETHTLGSSLSEEFNESHVRAIFAAKNRALNTERRRRVGVFSSGIANARRDGLHELDRYDTDALRELVLLMNPEVLDTPVLFDAMLCELNARFREYKDRIPAYCATNVINEF